MLSNSQYHKRGNGNRYLSVNCSHARSSFKFGRRWPRLPGESSQLANNSVERLVFVTTGLFVCSALRNAAMSEKRFAENAAIVVMDVSKMARPTRVNVMVPDSEALLPSLRSSL